ncbi:putative purine permease [Escherichia coli]|uniref:Putative purine permease n=1 Tax=Escherichia coli TaxID=562 RepID=A0A377BYY3_ECOLX|nr:putative purine permease [Escherichia coli]
MSDINHAGSDLIFELEDRPPFHQALGWCHYPSVGNFRSDGNPRVNRGCGLTAFPLKQLPILFLWR